MIVEKKVSYDSVYLSILIRTNCSTKECLFKYLKDAIRKANKQGYIILSLSQTMKETNVFYAFEICTEYWGVKYKKKAEKLNVSDNCIRTLLKKEVFNAIQEKGVSIGNNHTTHNNGLFCLPHENNSNDVWRV